MYEKIDEMLSKLEYTLEDFQNGKERNILGLLEHLKIYNFHTLNTLYNFINCRFNKNCLNLIIGDKNAYKSSTFNLVHCVFKS